jgi:hypothetical protein
MKHGIKMKMLILVTLLVSTLGTDLHEPEGFDLMGFVSASPIIRTASDTTIALGGSTTNSATRTDESCYSDLEMCYDQEMCCNKDGPCRCMLICDLLDLLTAIGEPNKR